MNLYILSAFLYYIENLSSLKDFLIIESNGESLCVLTRYEIKSIVKRFINIKSPHFSDHKKEMFSEYISNYIR